ncbi:hypothetical protein [Streptomyces sp. NPDC088261]|uniref:hypothetical protein n=1 Tax=Streptomyces sp. NPDC088261 TaxID=3365851 RepID=UPI003828B734
MFYLVPSRAPLTTEQVQKGFSFLLGLQLGGGSNVADRTDDPELPFVLLRLAEDIITPVTTLSDDDELNSDSFALDEVGGVLLSAFRDWARDSPTTAVLGIARTIIRFTTHVIPDPDHPDPADTLETMRDEHLQIAAAIHGTHP